MKAKSIELYFISGSENLTRTACIEFIERIVGTLHATVEKIAGIGILAVIGQFRVASIHRKIRGGSGVGACAQLRARARKAKQVENIGLRTVGDAAHRVG